MNQERKLQKKVADKRSEVVVQEGLIRENVDKITRWDFDQELEELVEETKGALSAFQEAWREAEKARDELEKVQDQEEEVE